MAGDGAAPSSRIRLCLIFSFGLTDCTLENGSRLRVSLERKVANTREILSEAKASLPSIFIGPVCCGA